MQGGGSVQGVEGVRRVYEQNGVAVVMFKNNNNNNNNNSNDNNNNNNNNNNEISLFHRIKIHKSQMLQIYDVDKKTR